MKKTRGKKSRATVPLKGLSFEIFEPVCWPVWLHLGLNKNRFWFLNFKEAPSILGSHFRFLCVSVQLATEDLVANPRELRTQLSIILGDFTILR
jgi:hypothetical protein